MMGGLSIPHHGLTAAFQNYHSNVNLNISERTNSPQPTATTTMCDNNNSNDVPSTITTAANNLSFTKPQFLLPAEFYKNLFASAAMFQKQTEANSGGGKSPLAALTTRSRSLTPSPTPMDGHHRHLQHPQQPIPRNLLFSCADKSSVDSDGEMDDKENIVEDEKKSTGTFAWSNEISVNSSTDNNNDTNNNNSVVRDTTNNPTNNRNSAARSPADLRQQQQQQQQINSSSTPVTITTTTAATTINCLPSGDHHSMPVPGAVGQGQNPTQGLVHWMSAVMAEHMTSNSHHDPAVGMHYMWNGVDQCGQHTKDIDTYGGWSASARNHMSMKQGYEAKMSSIDHHNNIQKVNFTGHMMDDGRMDHHALQGGAQMTPASIYGAAGAIRSGSSNSSSPGGIHGGVPHHGHHGGTSALLVVPQPINATKMNTGLTNGTGRKYHCKMCPQKHSNSSKKKIFSSKADLQLHTQIHMREAKPYKCSQCAKAFANSSYLSQHTRIHLGIKPYRCEICQRKFTQLSHLQQHIRTHTGDKPYKCRHPGCQKAFSQLSNLQSHSRCHQTDKPYKCNSCYKCFSDEPSLLEHIPKHKESKHLKTHICQYCGKSYTQETYLTKHMQKHAERTDKRPPIGVGGSGTTSVATNRNITLPTNAQLPGMTTDHPYWPKVSPDSAANLTDVMHQQQQQHHQPHAEFTIQHQNGHTELQPHHRGIIDHQQRGEENGEDLVISRQNSANGQTINGQNLSLPPSSTPMSSAGNYEVITKTTTNSAFTPINTMPPHLNTLGHHHQLSRQPYLYDAISFPNKNMVQNTTNSFPNQLISLHQIRNYAHQPSGLMAGEHLLGVSVGAGGKDKG